MTGERVTKTRNAETRGTPKKNWFKKMGERLLNRTNGTNKEGVGSVEPEVTIDTDHLRSLVKEFDNAEDTSEKQRTVNEILAEFNKIAKPDIGASECFKDEDLPTLHRIVDVAQRWSKAEDSSATDSIDEITKFLRSPILKGVGDDMQLLIDEGYEIFETPFDYYRFEEALMQAIKAIRSIYNKDVYEEIVMQIIPSVLYGGVYDSLVATLDAEKMQEVAEFIVKQREAEAEGYNEEEEEDDIEYVYLRDLKSYYQSPGEEEFGTLKDHIKRLIRVYNE